jgi:two-component system, OmpR family, response regulator
MIDKTQSIQVLVVDDDNDIRLLLCDFLQANGIQTLQAANASQVWQQLQSTPIDLIVLDINLPGSNGIDICHNIRANPKLAQLPVIMLTAKTSPLDRIIGLETGADDYVCKPFEPLELLSRIRSVLRRSYPILNGADTDNKHQYIQFNEWTLDLLGRHLLDKNQTVIALSSAEFKFLNYMLKHANRILTRDQLMEEMHGRDTAPFDRSIDLQISRLRQKIEIDNKHPQMIKTVRNEGYMLAATIEYKSS